MSAAKPDPGALIAAGMTDDQMDALLDAACDKAQAIARGDGMLAADTAPALAQVRALAQAAAWLDADHLFCDGCNNEAPYSQQVCEAAELPASQTAYDSNGDPDVTICPFCVLAAENEEPPMPEPPTEAERRREEEDALAALADWEDQ